MIALTSALEPIVFQLKVYRGTSYAAEFELLEKEGGPAFNLTGWTVTMTRNGLATLTTAAGGGLTVPTPANGIIELALTPAVTAGYPVKSYHSVLWVAKAGTDLVPAVGTTQVLNP